MLTKLYQKYVLQSLRDTIYDAFLGDVLFLKMDIEGYYKLKGAANMLKEVRVLDYSICTYHKKNDVVEISKILSDNRFESEFTEDFLYFEKDFRKTIICRK
jgi:hypothetical protein